MKIRKFTLLSTAALAFGATLLITPNARAVEAKTKLSSADERFIQEEAAAGGALVKLAELGAKKAERSDVRALADMIVSDHTKANAELAKLAADKGVEVSTEPVAKYADMHEKLEGTGDAEFDKEFLSMAVSGHKKCVKNFEEASMEAEDSELKIWATKMLPGLQAHLAKAEELSSASTGNSATKTSANSTTKPDNTARNMRDRDAKTLTPFDQGNSKSDIDTTARIRRELVDLEGLSINAQNVKIITNEGRVTLRGPVDSADEKRIIGEIATGIATPERTDNQLEVRQAEAAN